MAEMPPFDWPPFQPVWVWLYGAGAGGPGLLTRHALHALRQADVVDQDAPIEPVAVVAHATTPRLPKAAARTEPPAIICNGRAVLLPWMLGRQAGAPMRPGGT